MTHDEILSILHEEIRRIAPEVTSPQLKQTTRIREELDLDSFDFLRLVTALHSRLHVDIPETDYGKLRTIGECVEYLSRRS